MEHCALCGWLPTEGHALYEFPVGDPLRGRGRACGFCASERWGLPAEEEDT